MFDRNEHPGLSTPAASLRPVIWANPPNVGSVFVEQYPMDRRSAVIRHKNERLGISVFDPLSKHSWRDDTRPSARRNLDRGIGRNLADDLAGFQ